MTAARTLDASPPTRRRFTGAEWDRLVQASVFGPDERLELIDGEVVVMSPIGDVHAVVATLLDGELGRALTKGHHVREEKALRAGAHRVYPDLAVVAGDVPADSTSEWQYGQRTGLAATFTLSRASSLT